jgi:hypothetical protein
VPAAKWVKVGLEFCNNACHATSVVANSEGADWSLSALPPHHAPRSDLRVKIERIGYALWVWYEDEVLGWKKLREVTWFFWGVEDKAVRVGVYASRPADRMQGRETSAWTLRAWRYSNLHDERGGSVGFSVYSCVHVFGGQFAFSGCPWCKHDTTHEQLFFFSTSYHCYLLLPICFAHNLDSQFWLSLPCTYSVSTFPPQLPSPLQPQWRSA